MSTYDDIAEWYDTWTGTHSMREDPFFPAVESFIGEVAGQRICDLACGQGRVTRYLADLGARVVDIDLSAKLLALARDYEETRPRGIEYLQADAQSLDDKALGLFDGVLCFMALMDIPDLSLHCTASHAFYSRLDGLSFPSSTLASTPLSLGRWRLQMERFALLADTLWRAIGGLIPDRDLLAKSVYTTGHSRPTSTHSLMPGCSLCA